MNGITGCSARNTASNTTSSVWRVEAAAAASSPFKAGLESSRNQSQYSFHTNSYRACARWSKRYETKCCSTSASVCARRVRIHRSASVTGFSESPIPTSESPTFINTKRAAFHSLLQNAL